MAWLLRLFIIEENEHFVIRLFICSCRAERNNRHFPIDVTNMSVVHIAKWLAVWLMHAKAMNAQTTNKVFFSLFDGAIVSLWTRVEPFRSFCFKVTKKSCSWLHESVVQKVNSLNKNTWLCANDLRAKRPSIVYPINKVRAAGDGWAGGQSAVSHISVHLHKDSQTPRPTASQYR